MAASTWEPSYSLKLDKMDRQHQRILAIMGMIDEALADEGAGIQLEELLVKLETFSKAHFFDEERLMESKNFPSTAEHKRQHDRFMDEISRLRSKTEEIKNKRSFSELSGWFINHILTEDMRYSEFFLNNH